MRLEFVRLIVSALVASIAWEPGVLARPASQELTLTRGLRLMIDAKVNGRAVDPQTSASDVNAGVSLLRHFRIATDYASHAVWLQPRY